MNAICLEVAFCRQRCNIVLRERHFPLAFYGGTVSEVDCKFSHWITCISKRKETTTVFAAY